MHAAAAWPKVRDAVTTLLTGRGDEDVLVRRIVVKVLAHTDFMGTRTAVPGLTQALREDPDREVRLTSTQALVTAAGRDAIPILEAALKKAKSKAERTSLASSLHIARLQR